MHRQAWHMTPLCAAERASERKLKMRHLVFMQKLAEDRESDDGVNVARGAGAATLGLGAAALSTAAATRASRKMFLSGIADRKREFESGKQLADAIKSQKYLRAGSLPVDLSRIGEKDKAGYYRMYTPEGRKITGHRGAIGGYLARGGTVLSHEFGHATGSKVPHQLSTNLHKATQRARPAMMSGVALMAGSARTKEQLDRAEKFNNAAAAAATLGHAPRLIEEARASIRGSNLMKKMIGKRPSHLALAGAYGTYVGGTLVPTATQYAINRRFISRGRAALEQEQKRAR